LPIRIPLGALSPLGALGNCYDVVYVATENNSIYAIDVKTGNILLRRNLSPPGESAVPSRGSNATVLDCFTGNVVGINSTPVIDPASGLMYVIAFSYNSTTKSFHYYIHELNLSTLNDVITPVLVQASRTATTEAGKMTTTFEFNAQYQQQSAALVLANGTVYAGFSSFCDDPGDTDATIGPNGGSVTQGSRGWLIGWEAGSLKPLNDVQLNNLVPTAELPLASIWMSNAGPAADANGLYFVTGNSGVRLSDSPYDFADFPNIPGSLQESVVGVSFDLTTIKSIFTPSNQAALDSGDLDFGAGGVMLLPGSTLAVAAGKYDWDGTNGGMYVLDRTAINPSGGGPVVSKGNTIGPCFCAPSYFQDASGAGHIVSSGGITPMVWQVPPLGAQLIQEASNHLTPPNQGSGTKTCPPPDASLGQAGFFTSISSTKEHTDTIIWATLQMHHFIYACDSEAKTNSIILNKECENSSGSYTCSEVWLYAFDATQVNNTKVKALPQIFSAQAGIWDPATGGKANLIPVVADGRVFVASWGQLDIFGLFVSCGNAC
jgi:hypothetical protein